MLHDLDNVRQYILDIADEYGDLEYTQRFLKTLTGKRVMVKLKQ